MDIRYNAFISYRHHPVDIKVAEQIHRSLEHYRIPKALKKNKDTKLRLFRDKEELPITSNLSGDITLALEKSDYLIVICSTHTKESVWVQREIETFLQTHDHRRILTVLVDGEPYDTIPEILCSDERIDPVSGEKQIIPIEPLSCDWRVSRGKARREELPRLAAALLGCGYDELRQREKQYRTRRLATGLSVALAATIAFSGYVIRNSMKIRKANEELEKANVEIRRNLEEAQINHSQYLAGASAQKLEEGDRMQAVALALAALPEYEGQRPYVAQAEKALAEAVGAYVSENEIAAVGCISCDAQINIFEATDNRDRMFVCDQRDVLSVWDLKTYGKLHSVQLEKFVLEMLVTPQDRLIVLMSGILRCYDRDLNLLWEREGGSQIVLSEARDVLLVNRDYDIVEFLDTATGEPVREPIAVEPYAMEIDSWDVQFTQKRYDLDQPMPVRYTSYNEGDVVFTVDLQDGTITEICRMPEDVYISLTYAEKNGNILVLTTPRDGDAGRFLDMRTYSKIANRLWCFTPEGKQLWTTEMPTFTYSNVRTIYEIAGTGQLFCQVDDAVAVLDDATGEVLRETRTGSTPVWVQPYEEDAIIMMEDGSIGVFTFDEEELNSYRYFTTNLSKGFGGKGYYVKEFYGSRILIYSLIRDDHWKMIGGDYRMLNGDSVSCGDYAAIYNYDEILMFDLRSREVLWSLPEEGGMSFRFIGFSENGAELWILNQQRQLLRMDSRTGTWKSYELPENADGRYLSYSSYNHIFMDEGVIYTYAKSFAADIYCSVVAFDTKTCTGTVTDICLVESSGYDSGILAASGGEVYFWEDTGKQLYHLDMAAGTCETMPLRTTSRPIVQFLHDGNTVMISQDNSVVFREGEEVLLEKDLKDLRAVAAYSMEQEFIVLMDSGVFMRFDLTGKKLSEWDGYFYTNTFNDFGASFRPEKIIWQETGDGDLFVNILGSGNLIDMDSHQVRAWIPSCIAYAADLDMFVVTGKDPDTNKSRMGLYQRYSLQQIMEMARSAMGEYTLTDEQKESYGIS